MNILITAGGTSEKIDHVRSITNHSTGKLGCKLATLFLQKGHRVLYLTTPQALKPKPHLDLELIEIETTYELVSTLKEIIRQQHFHAIIHSMAVSDFTPESSFPEEELWTILGEKLASLPKNLTREAWMNYLQDEVHQTLSLRANEAKISSNSQHLMLLLKKNPKVIAMFRQYQPSSILVGFKLLVDVSEKKLLQVADDLLKKNECDFVLANDLTQIQGEQHLGFLLNKDGTFEKATTKQEIAEKIVFQIENTGASI